MSEDSECCEKDQKGSGNESDSDKPNFKKRKSFKGSCIDPASASITSRVVENELYYGSIHEQDSQDKSTSSYP